MLDTASVLFLSTPLRTGRGVSYPLLQLPPSSRILLETCSDLRRERIFLSKLIYKITSIAPEREVRSLVEVGIGLSSFLVKALAAPP